MEFSPTRTKISARLSNEGCLEVVAIASRSSSSPASAEARKACLKSVLEKRAGNKVRSPCFGLSARRQLQYLEEGCLSQSPGRVTELVGLPFSWARPASGVAPGAESRARRRE
eukprot:scaffold735_cov255-Pinguiococcus_pyrenoidosus.AAC.13